MTKLWNVTISTTRRPSDIEPLRNSIFRLGGGRINDRRKNARSAAGGKGVSFRIFSCFRFVVFLYPNVPLLHHEGSLSYHADADVGVDTKPGRGEAA